MLQKIYADNYYKTQHFIINNSGSAEEAKDIYQEAFLVLWQKLKSGDLDIRDSNHINAFLYRVAHNKWIDYLRSKEFSSKSYLDDSAYDSIEAPDHETDKEWESKITRVAGWIQNLKPDCRRLLTGFYFYRKSMRTLAQQFKMDEASVKNKKYRCMERLKKLAFDKL
ncbi:MAG: sigma-70 family RNA polymerase sigma factor [Bacteroidetes bacterium]|nr:MAG: sigma-70 family RNA polymerase sigma factor [Bacteroidota bacterium]